MADDEDKVPELLGEPTKATKQRLYYSAVKWGDHTYRPNDIVFLEAEPTPFVGIIRDIFKVKKEGDIMASIRWFFRWTDIEYDISVLDRPKHSNELFLGMIIDENLIETIVSPCDLTWVVGGTKEGREEKKAALQASDKLFCSHIYFGEFLIPVFHPTLSEYTTDEQYAELLTVQENIRHDKVEEEDDIDTMVPVVQHKEGKKRKAQASAEPPKKKGRQSSKQSIADDVIESSFDEVKSITLSRRNLLLFHQSKSRDLLKGFFVRVPIQRKDEKRYEIARIEELTPLPDTTSECDGFRIHCGLLLKMANISEAVDSGMQHVSSSAPLEVEFFEYLKHEQFPSRSTIQRKVADLAVLTKDTGL